MTLPSAAKTRTALTLAAGAAAAVTAGQRANAAVIYHPADVPVNAANPSFTLDFDHDGITDVTLYYSNTSGLTVTGNPGSFKLPGASYIPSANPSAVRGLAAGDVIDGTGATGQFGGFTTTPFPLIYSIPAVINDAMGTGDFTAAGGERYIGVSFPAAVGFEYGWVGFRVDDDSSVDAMSGTVTGFAYDDAGQPITAGAIPEPSSLGLLAMGATGLAAYRRRGR